MKKVNLRDLYPDVYKNDHFVEVTEDVLETIQSAERAEAPDTGNAPGGKAAAGAALCRCNGSAGEAG